MLELGLHVRAPLGCLGFHLGLRFFRVAGWSAIGLCCFRMSLVAT